MKKFKLKDSIPVMSYITRRSIESTLYKKIRCSKIIDHFLCNSIAEQFYSSERILFIYNTSRVTRTQTKLTSRRKTKRMK